VSDEQQLATSGVRPRSDLSLTDDVVWAVLEGAPDAVLLVDGEGRIVLANQQVEAMFGYERAELLGEPVDVWCPTSCVPRTRATGLGTTPRPGCGRWVSACGSRDAGVTVRSFPSRSV
jgi:PAS domain-containing protein